MKSKGTLKPIAACILHICQRNKKCQQPHQCGAEGFNAVKRSEEYKPLYTPGEGHHHE